MNITAQQKFIRVSPRKLRLLARSLAGLTPDKALDQLKFARHTGADVMAKTIKQAVANATNNHSLNQSQLAINQIEIGEGPTYKRWRAVSRGRAHSIFKRTSHLTITLKSLQPTTPQSTPTASKSQLKSVKPKASAKKLASKKK